MSAAAVTRVSGAGQAPPTPDIWGEARRSRYRVTRDNHLDTQLSIDIQNSSAEGNQIFLMGCSCSGSGQTEQSYYPTLIVSE